MARQTADDVMQFLERAIPEMASSVNSLRADIAGVERIAEQNNRALRGWDGEPGLLADVQALCKVQEKNGQRLAGIEADMYKGSDTVPGLVDQVRVLTKWQKQMRYWYVLFIGAIVVGVINILLELVSRNLLGGGV